MSTPKKKTRRGRRVLVRGHCEKCATVTNRQVKVVDRWAYWCGCN